jgi:hypothetical protein
MDHHSEIVPLEIDAIIADLEAMQDFAVPFQFSKTFQLRAHDLLREPSKFPQDVQLQLLWHLRQLRSARGIENDLKGAHEHWDVFSKCICQPFQADRH